MAAKKDSGRKTVSENRRARYEYAITDTWEAYFMLAPELANDGARRQELRQRMAKQRLTSPLFDTHGFTIHLEHLFKLIWAQHATGERKALVIPNKT